MTLARSRHNHRHIVAAAYLFDAQRGKERMKSFDRRRLLDLRNHIQIAHHIPGRIRLRLVPTIVDAVNGLDRGLLRLPFSELEGIRSARINALALSAIIEYDTKTLAPDWWETAFEGSDDEVSDLSVVLEDLWGGTIGSWKARANGMGAAV